MTAGARELLTAVSPRGEFRIEQRGAGAAVVVAGAELDDDRVFYDESNREVAQRYRFALAELERAGLIERDDSIRRLTAMGWTAARFLTRQELDRIAVLVRHLSEPEQRLLRLVASCQQRYSVDKVVLRRDGTSLSAVYGNGQTVPVPGVRPLAETLPEDDADAADARFEQLVEGMPAEYLETLPAQRLGNPFVLRVTETGSRYLRHAEVVVSTRGLRQPVANASAGGAAASRPALMRRRAGAVFTPSAGELGADLPQPPCIPLVRRRRRRPDLAAVGEVLAAHAFDPWRRGQVDRGLRSALHRAEEGTQQADQEARHGAVVLAQTGAHGARVDAVRGDARASRRRASSSVKRTLASFDCAYAFIHR